MSKINFKLPLPHRNCQDIHNILKKLNLQGTVYTKYVLMCENDDCILTTSCEINLPCKYKLGLHKIWDELEKKYKIKNAHLSFS